MKNFALSFALLTSMFGSSSAFAVSLEDLQTKLAPLIPKHRAALEMSGRTTSSRGATCFTSISVKPDEVEFFSTWGDSGRALRLSADDEIEIEESATEMKISTVREGLPSSVTLTLRGSEVYSMLFEETRKTLFFTRVDSHLCDQQIRSFPDAR